MKIVAHKMPAGFSLVEMAIVLMIVGLLLGGLIPTLSAQMESQRINETRKQLDEIKEALIGFAIANGRFPCPATTASNGDESFASGGSATDGNCSNYYNGYVPAAKLGIASVDSNTKLVLDAWNNPIRYAVADNTVSGVPHTFTRTNGMQSATMDNIANADLLYICASATGIGSDCGTATNKLTDKTPALIYSTGKNGGYSGSGLDETANPNPNSTNNDRVFVSHTPTPRTDPNGEFDDLVIWISPNTLFNRMVAAGKLP